MTATQLPLQQKTERLTEAFRIFNALSEHLSHSYQALQQQVARLTQELAAARVERQATLTEKEQLANRFQQILAALPAAVVLVDTDETIIDCNTHAIDFLGEPLLGLRWPDILKRSRAVSTASLHECKLNDGRTVSIRRSSLNESGEQLILLSDVTELHHLQEILLQQRQLAALGEMVATLAHQVRTPLATAILYASHLVKPELDADKRLPFSTKLLERLHHLERQIDDMLLFAKQGRLHKQVFSVEVLLAHIAEAMEHYSVAFVLERRSRLGDMLGNQDALRGALLNLLNNAVEAGAKRIRLTVAQRCQNLEIGVEDNGQGMDEEQLRHIFSPFFTTKSHGNGLGLAVAQRVVAAHHGTISCRSSLGHGSHFTVNLPLEEPHQLNPLPVSLAARREGPHENL